ncbi:2-keto-3-deoxy-galactonokinase [Marinovum algicola]|uniref:2-dehydro-3-deoxygalactonokinase n=1 Tax=Marinovum algicola TaxID=42444 RepID=A0A975WFF2_9RHOB|nr:2-dehydro-3-deoxygalactonokinase [Marinovum algicola]SEK11119.1 2-dehydro-3-deoxygalactonokinase [Marinovum algicola]SLN71165.1 2-keto-3-deoxy-galactonokinase [Marinovum algicola]
MAPTHSIFVDWGTSNLRAYLLDASGKIIAQRYTPQGIKKIENGACPGILRAMAVDWDVLSAGTRVLMAGMVGSEMGWREVALVPAPCDAKDIADNLVNVSAEGFHDVRIVPGVLSHQPKRPAGMMRGEEVQSIGAFAMLEQQDAIICLPGSHSKWVDIQDSKIAGISTFMTGEMFEIVGKHSTLRGLVEQSPSCFDAAGFREGLAMARTELNLMQLIFSIRTEAVARGGPLPCRDAARLSGILIGSETRAAIDALDIQAETAVYLASDTQLMRAYDLALREFGQRVVTVDAESAFLNGCRAINKAADVGAEQPAIRALV